MVLSTVQEVVVRIFVCIETLHPIIRYVLLIPIVALTSFRLWAFTIKPLLRPNEPKELPYWIPYLGHAVAFTKDGQELVTRAREYFSNTREPFALTIGGEKLYFLTSPDDAAYVFKHTEAFDFESIVHDFVVQFGVSPAAADKIHQSPQSELQDPVAEALGIKNPCLKPLSHLHSDMWRRQLLSGQNCHDLQNDLISRIDQWLMPARLDASCDISTEGDGTMVVSLLQLTRQVMMDAGLRAFFGTQLLDLDPDFIRQYLTFDDENWKLWYKWPGAGKMYAAKAHLAQTMQRYLALPDCQRANAAPIIQSIIKSERALGISDIDLTNMLCIVVFAINTNTYKVLFWCLAYLLNNQQLFTKVRAEATAAFDSSSSLSSHDNEPTPSLEYLMNKSPYLAGTFHEVLRLSSASFSMRQVTASDTYVGSKLIPKNARVVVPVRQLHYNPSVYGPDPAAFHVKRWVSNKTLASNSSYRPFGAGSSYCPGRNTARQQVSVFIAFLLRRFDVSAIPGQGFPVMDRAKPTTGLMAPKEGEDLLLKLTPRANI